MGGGADTGTAGKGKKRGRQPDTTTTTSNSNSSSSSGGSRHKDSGPGREGPAAVAGAPGVRRASESEGGRGGDVGGGGWGEAEVLVVGDGGKVVPGRGALDWCRPCGAHVLREDMGVSEHKGSDFFFLSFLRGYENDHDFIYLLIGDNVSNRPQNGVYVLYG